jgi:site-specific recombinase XerD
MDTTEQRAIFKQYLYRRYGDRSTPYHYLSDLDIFLRVLGNKSLQCVTAQDIDRFIDDQHCHGLAASTINRRLATLHTLFECLAAQAPDENRLNPVIWRRHRVKEGHLLPRDAADQDVERLFGIIDQARDAAMFGLMVGAGLRVAEVAQLRLGDLRVPPASGQLAQLLVRGKGGKERMVWLTPFWYAKVAAWLAVRPTTSADYLFLNQHGDRISKDGIQYRLQGYCAAAGISITCHQLRHTFARRLADQRMPIESIAKLLGHAFVTTTQRYTLGANPDLRAAFQAAMAQIESCQTLPEPELPFAHGSRPRQQPEPADAARLPKALGHFASLPEWLASELCLYARQRWYGWKPHMATRYINRLASQQFNIWSWLLAHCELRGWQDLRRHHLESWQDARHSAGLNVISCYTELCDLRAFLKFVGDRGQPLDPNVFRIPPPNFADPLPKHLSTPDYERLVKTVLAETEQPTLSALAGRAWFLTLAHTGMRLNELLDLRLGDVDFANGRILICNPKGGHDRVAFMTPSLAHSLHLYIMQRPAGADDHLWCNNGRLLADEALRNQLARWGQLCGVKVTPHQLRHTFATQLVNHGLPIDSVRKLLGHQTLNMTQHYARMFDTTVKQQFAAATEAFEAMLIPDWPVPATAVPVTSPKIDNSVDSV